AAAERAARRLSPDHVAVLREMADVTYCLDDPQSHVAFLDANRTFHLTLAAGSGNRRLADELGTVMLEMDRLFHLGLRVRDSAQEMKQEHQDVVAALEAGDVDAVKDLVAQQILTSQTRVMEAILRGHIQSIHIGE
ncbi:MAG: FCD domain-containing protein, partial [Anaerolineae bacterium]|nr:FCD domain-containing protein [Anaerolineae bacterium]